MNNILNLQTLAASSDAELMEWSTISNHCGDRGQD
ncbi:class III lanthipeptide [Shewanella sp. KX20019]|nr:class III lanthipeptide [Shewanella sp. KX20019]QQX80934.1 class III lanthipeptide [Shewanella sp. KX20019]